MGGGHKETQATTHCNAPHHYAKQSHPQSTNTPQQHTTKPNQNKTKQTNAQTNAHKHTTEQYVLPGLDAAGYIACTGTNFCLRARALAAVGWFPTYTITEDYALSMELRAAGFKGRCAILTRALAGGGDGACGAASASARGACAAADQTQADGDPKHK